MRSSFPSHISSLPPTLRHVDLSSSSALRTVPSPLFRSLRKSSNLKSLSTSCELSFADFVFLLSSNRETFGRIMEPYGVPTRFSVPQDEWSKFDEFPPITHSLKTLELVTRDTYSSLWDPVEIRTFTSRELIAIAKLLNTHRDHLSSPIIGATRPPQNSFDSNSPPAELWLAPQNLTNPIPPALAGRAKCAGLTSLSLIRLPNLDNSALSAFLECCPMLRTLVIRGAAKCKLGDEALGQIFCQPHLEHVTIADAPLMTGTVLSDAPRCPNLVALSLHGLPLVSTESLLEFCCDHHNQDRAPSLTTLTITRCPLINTTALKSALQPNVRVKCFQHVRHEIKEVGRGDAEALQPLKGSVECVACGQLISDVLQDHHQVCADHVRPCPLARFGCTQTMKRKEVAGHLLKECAAFLVKCGECGEEVLRVELEKHAEAKHHEANFAIVRQSLHMCPLSHWGCLWGAPIPPHARLPNAPSVLLGTSSAGGPALEQVEFYKDLKIHFATECDKYEIACPGGCGRAFLRKDVFGRLKAPPQNKEEQHCPGCGESWTERPQGSTEFAKKLAAEFMESKLTLCRNARKLAILLEKN